MRPRQQQPWEHLPEHCRPLAAADERHFLPLGVRLACARRPGLTLEGRPLSLEEAVQAVLSALIAALRFTDMWQYIMWLETIPEKDPCGLRKAPSRWGAVFTRSVGIAEQVVDEGNAFYYKVISLLEAMAVRLGMPPLRRLRLKTNLDKLRDRAGDYLEAVLGRPALEQHLAAGGVDTGYSDWTDERAREWCVNLGHTDPRERAAARMLQLVAAVQDLDAVLAVALVAGSTWSAEDLIELVFSADRHAAQAALVAAVTPEAAARIQRGDAAAPASRRRSAAGILRQEERRRRLWGARPQFTAGGSSSSTGPPGGTVGGSSSSTGPSGG